MCNIKVGVKMNCMKKVKITILKTTLDEQLAKEYGVEGSHPQLRGNIMPDKALDAFTHFAGSLVGKGERHEAIGFITQLQQMHNLVGEHTGFARPGTGNHQRWSVAIFYSSSLLLIELFQVVFQL